MNRTDHRLPTLLAFVLLCALCRCEKPAEATEKNKTQDDGQTPAAQSRRKLAEIADRMDADRDGLVSLDELERWIGDAQLAYRARELEKQWKTHNPSSMRLLTWEEYRMATYSFLDRPDTGIGQPDRESYLKMERRDRRRFALADADGDGALSKEEFALMQHPEHSERMKPVVVDETLEDMDRDGDGRVSLQEYVGDLLDLPPGEPAPAADDEPDWLRSERRQFAELRDRDGDGFLDRDEMREWLMPSGVHSEAEQLMQEADADGDRRLSTEEILSSYDLFVGSEATDYGDALVPAAHDEL